MDQVDRVVTLVTDVVGSDLVGIYLHGSAVLGGLQPASDLDILAVSRRSLDDRRRRALLAIAITLAGGRPLAGPPPGLVFAPVPTADLARASVVGIPALLDDLPGDTRNVVLTLARIWSTLATGGVRSKDAAADWALPRLAPKHRPVLEHARWLYLNRTYHEETWSAQLRTQVRPYVDDVLDRIRGLESFTLGAADRD